MDKTARKFMIDDLAIREPTTVSFKEKHITSQDRTMSGKLVVDYIASKKTISVGWGVLNDDEFKKLKALAVRADRNPAERNTALRAGRAVRADGKYRDLDRVYRGS